MTFLGELNTVMVLMAVLYWCVRKELGVYLLMGVERRFVGFSTEVSILWRVIRCAVGLAAYFAITLLLTPQIKEWIGGPAGTMISCFVQMLYITFLFPWLMNAIEKRCA